ncbi:MAG: OmpA family protein [Rhodospirillales bacterium]|nr:OmpA family protein [Rhodospirillales bacterium]
MAQRERTGNKKDRPIIVRREEGGAAAHHGGAWKVAYADFVTAMMAFFLVMWLINATTEQQRQGLADYFSPTNLMSHHSSGTGKPFGGETAFSNGAMVSDKGAVEVTVGLHPVLDNPLPPRPHLPKTTPRGGRGPDHAASDTVGQSGSGTGAARGAGNRPAGAAGAPRGTEPHGTEAPPARNQALLPGALLPKAHVPGALPHEARPADAPAPVDRRRTADRAFAVAASAIRRKVRQDPRLAAFAAQLAIDLTPRGLRIQLLDSRRSAMFPPGSAVPTAPARRLLRLIGPIVAGLAGPVRIAGFTDAAPYPGGRLTNWDLSAARANAARRVLTASDLPDRRIQAVTGHGDHDLLLPRDPFAPANRRISILVLRSTVTSNAAGSDTRPQATAAPAAERAGTGAPKTSAP